MWYDRPRPGSWRLSKAELDGAIRAIEKVEHVDQKHDIPYTAGYSKDGKTLYVDQALPEEWEGINLYRYILLHEAVEKALIDLGLSYLHAHQIALRAERAAVEADGIDWNKYNAICMRWVKKIGARKEYPCCPEKLDLKPYKDEQDTATLDKMKFEP